MTGPANYFLRIRGRVTGPYSLADLQRMARMGTISRAIEISADRQSWVSAGNVEGIFAQGISVPPTSTPPASSGLEEIVESAEVPLAPLQPNSPPVPAPAPLPPAAYPAVRPRPADAGTLRTRVGKLSLTQGICTGALLLFCLLVPHTRISGSLQWWWDLSSVPGGAMLLCGSILGMLLGVCLTFLPAVVSGPTRGYTLIGLATAALIVLILVAALGPCESLSMGLASLAPLALAALAAATFVRRALPQAPAGKTAQASAAALALAACLTGGILTVWSLLAGEGPLPAWALVTVILAIVGWAGTLAAGTVGLVAACQARFAPAAHTACIVLVLASLGVLLVAAGIGGIGAANAVQAIAPEGGRFLLVQVLRLSVSAYALAALAAVGFSEILVHALLPQRPAAGSTLETVT